MAEVKTLLFLVETIAHQGILMTGKNVLILGEEPTDESNDTTITIDAKYSVNNTKSRKKACLSLHCNASNSVLYTNGVTVYQFKARDSKIKPYPLHLENMSKDFQKILLIT